MRWPFGPPHLTLKPSNKKQKTKKTKKNKKTRKKRSPKKKQQKYPKMSFSVISQIFPFFGWLFKISLFWHLRPKSLNPKNTIKIGVSGPFFWKSSCASRNGHFWTKKTKIHKFQLSFFLPIFFSFNNQKTQKVLKPLFYSVLANQKKENFQKNNLKHWKLKSPFFAPLFWKRLFLENWKITGNKKNTNW